MLGDYEKSVLGSKCIETIEFSGLLWIFGFNKLIFLFEQEKISFVGSLEITAVVMLVR